jgi:hypothetical protein
MDVGNAEDSAEGLKVESVLLVGDEDKRNGDDEVGVGDG